MTTGCKLLLFAAKEPSKICSDVCDSLSWADWAMDNLDSGLMYCCEVAALKAKVDYAPDLTVDGVWPELLADK